MNEFIVKYGKNYSYPYEQWLIGVESYVKKTVGFSLKEMPDFPGRQWFDAEMSAEQAGIRIIQLTSSK